MSSTDNYSPASNVVVSGGDSFSNVSTVTGATVLSGGRFTNYAGGKVSNLVISSGGAFDNEDSTVTSAVLEKGGKFTFVGGTVTSLTVNDRMSVTGDGGSGKAYLVSAQINDGGFVVAYNGATVTQPTVSSNGSLELVSGSKLSGTMTLANGGSATLWSGAGGAVTMDGSTNTGLVITDLASGGTLTTTINGFNGTAAGNSDGIEIDGVKASDVAKVEYTDADNVKLTLKNGGIINMHIPGAEAAGYSLQTAKDGDLLFEVCFLAGSMIATPDADVAVETLEIGDVVKTWNWQSQSVENRTIVWVGKKHMTVKAGMADDAAGYPVRVLKNAIAEGVPYKDMLITPEHSLFFENKFVPVRMLVNGRSIFYDRSIQSYDYFHVETEDHSVIWADGMMTESYLDTGNRSTFRQEGGVARLTASDNKKAKNWTDDSAAALSVNRDVVELLYRQIDSRARQNGLPKLTAEPKLVTDPDLHLVTDKGQVIRQARSADDAILFMIPSGVETVYLASRASKPSEAVGPFVDDRRQLGVLVGAIQVIGAGKAHTIDSHCTQENLAGWDVKEATPCRWTNGYAELPLGNALSGRFGMLSIQILAAGPYLETETAPNTTQKTA